MRRRRRSSRLGLFFALVLGGGLLGASVWLDQRGEEVFAPGGQARARHAAARSPRHLVPVVRAGSRGRQRRRWVLDRLLLRAPAPRIPNASEGTARVSAATVVAKSPERGRSRRRSRSYSSGSLRRLALPYQVAQLRLALPSRGDSVLVVDAVDSGSVAGLAVGAEVPVRYESDAPRDARLAQRTRQFVERNRYHFLPVVIGVPAIGMLAAWGFRSRRRRPRATSRADSAVPSNVPA